MPQTDFDEMQAQSKSAAVENLRVKQCGMLLAYTTSRHPAVTPGQTRQALLQVNRLPAVLSVCLAWIRCPLCSLLAVADACSNTAWYCADQLLKQQTQFSYLIALT